MKKQSKGITLIALIITIIILLILAMVTIQILTNQGIIRHARNAADKTELERLKEEITLVLDERKIEKVAGGNSKTLKQDLEDKITGDKTVEEAEGLADTCYVTRNGQTVTAYEDGDIVDNKVATWDGKSSESPEFKEFNWYIYTPGQLKFLADFVNNGNALAEGQEELLTKAGYNPSDVTMTEETMVYLMNNLDLGARPTNGNWETTKNEERKWAPIGPSSAKKLLGTFDGQENTIKGVYVNQEANFGGVFGNTNTIKKLKISDSYIKGGNHTGGMVGALRTGNIQDCHNINTIVVSEGYMAGGIVAQSTGNLIQNCSNSGKVICNGTTATSSKTSLAGGIAGASYYSSVYNCYNTGDVKAAGAQVGGVCGTQGYTDKTTTLSHCYNTGSVTGGISRDIGGVIGYCPGNTTVEYTYNSGMVRDNGNEGSGGIGGIIGTLDHTSVTSDSYNKGKISTNHTVKGLVIGRVDSADAKASDSYYYSQLGTGAINGQDDEENNVRGIDVDLKSYEEFITWINQQ